LPSLALATGADRIRARPNLAGHKMGDGLPKR
jgi:hypothetical protein